MSTDELKLKTVAVLGGSYGGECPSFVTLDAIWQESKVNYLVLFHTPTHPPLF